MSPNTTGLKIGVFKSGYDEYLFYYDTNDYEIFPLFDRVENYYEDEMIEFCNDCGYDENQLSEELNEEHPSGLMMLSYEHDYFENKFSFIRDATEEDNLRSIGVFMNP
jgi:hypothetical protein